MTYYCRAICMFFLLTGLFVSAEKKHVLLIESYHADYEWDVSYRSGLEEILNDSCYFTYFRMDTKRCPASAYRSKADLAWEAYQKSKPDVVILGDDNALKFLGKRFGETDTPVVFLGINNNPRIYEVSQFKNITGVLERPLLKRSLAFIDSIMPLKRVLVLFDNGTTAKAVHSHTFGGKTSNKIGAVKVDVMCMSSFEDWKGSVLGARQSGYDVVIMGLYHTLTDKNNKHVPAGDIEAWTSQNSPIPPFAFWDFSVGKGSAIGGYVLFGKEQGVVAGTMVMDILAGKDPAKIHLKVAEKGRFLFSLHQLEKWKIQLPNSISSRSEFID